MMKKTVEELKSFSYAEHPIGLIMNTKDYTFIELLELSKLSGLLGWKITFSNAAHLETKELFELAKHSEDLTFDLR